MGNRQNTVPGTEPLNPIQSQASDQSVTSVPTLQLNSHLTSSSLSVVSSEYDFVFTFKFDSLVKGTMSIYFFAAESVNPKGVTECYYIDTERYPSPITKSFPAELNQDCNENLLFDLNKYSSQELSFSDRKTYPLIIELRTDDATNIIESTYIKFRLNGTQWQPELMKQKFTYGSDVFEINEIYGHAGIEEETKECVVCLTNLKETLVVPCDHMCLCMECANIMRSQYDSKCPMCRTVVQSLMNIVHN
jgi:E3 ubiquitin-protein ligase MGRN1